MTARDIGSRLLRTIGTATTCGNACPDAGYGRRRDHISHDRSFSRTHVPQSHRGSFRSSRMLSDLFQIVSVTSVKTGLDCAAK